MARLLRANLIRMKNNKFFWIAISFSVLFALLICYMKYRNMIDHGMEQTVDGAFFSYYLIIGFPIAVFTTLFIGTEYSDGTIRNKLITGSGRRALYLANFITSATAAIVMNLAYTIVVYVVGTRLVGPINMPWHTLFQMHAIGMLLVISLSAISTLVSMLVPNKTIVAIAVILCLVAGLVYAAQMTSRLAAPEFYSGIVVDESGTQYVENVVNRSYLDPVQRQIYQLIVEIVPTGQCHLLADMTVSHPWRMMLFSIIMIFVTTFSGIVIFEKKDLK